MVMMAGAFLGPDLPDEAEVDDVDAEVGVDDLEQRVPDGARTGVVAVNGASAGRLLDAGRPGPEGSRWRRPGGGAVRRAAG